MNILKVEEREIKTSIKKQRRMNMLFSRLIGTKYRNGTRKRNVGRSEMKLGKHYRWQTMDLKKLSMLNLELILMCQQILSLI